MPQSHLGTNMGVGAMISDFQFRVLPLYRDAAPHQNQQVFYDQEFSLDYNGTSTKTLILNYLKAN